MFQIDILCGRCLRVGNDGQRKMTRSKICAYTPKHNIAAYKTNTPVE